MDAGEHYVLIRIQYLDLVLRMLTLPVSGGTSQLLALYPAVQHTARGISAVLSLYRGIQRLTRCAT